MANEMRDRLVEILGDEGCTKPIPCDICEYKDFYDCHNYARADRLIENDVVPVVRCKDCKWLCKSNLLCTHKRNRVFNTGIKRDFNCYCNYGEKEDEGNEIFY